MGLQAGVGLQGVVEGCTLAPITSSMHSSCTHYGCTHYGYTHYGCTHYGYTYSGCTYYGYTYSGYTYYLTSSTHSSWFIVLLPGMSGLPVVGWLDLDEDGR